MQRGGVRGSVYPLDFPGHGLCNGKHLSDPPWSEAEPDPPLPPHTHTPLRKIAGSALFSKQLRHVLALFPEKSVNKCMLQAGTKSIACHMYLSYRFAVSEPIQTGQCKRILDFFILLQDTKHWWTKPGRIYV